MDKSPVNPWTWQDAYGFSQAVLVQGGTFEGPLLKGREPNLVGELERTVEVLALDVERAHLPSRGQSNLAAAGHVVADLPDRPNRVLESQVSERE